ncbi:MAG: Ni/Fe-hydrogenase cytochrome b subunit [Phycisphaerales bacterium]|nr:Ni/Fe-hydrogenase cytochrome b subunit [Phycisphaerales bacterium]
MNTHSDTITGVKPRFITPGMMVVLGIAALGWAVWVYRMAFGLGATTNLSNAYPWGIWIAIDVACGVALAAGGFTTAFLAEILHRGRYHALLRPALLTAMIGYTFVALGVMTDLGRFWAMWHVMLPPYWQPNSVLFEVAVCVMCYLTVLYIEFLPIVCERFAGKVNLPMRLGVLNGLVDRVLRLLDATLHRVILVFVILGCLLSCMHQSSLGTLMVIADEKLHPLWQTPYLPLMFILTAFSVGYPMVIFESLIASRSFGLEPERGPLSGLARFTPFVLSVYLCVKVFDLVNRGVVGLLFDGSWQSFWYMFEIGVGVIGPIVIFASPRLRRHMGWLFAAATMVIVGVVLNRLNVFLICYTPLEAGARYTPSLGEYAVTAGFIATIVALYRFVVLNFPVIEGLEHVKAHAAASHPTDAAGSPPRARRPRVRREKALHPSVRPSPAGAVLPAEPYA